MHARAALKRGAGTTLARWGTFFLLFLVGLLLGQRQGAGQSGRAHVAPDSLSRTTDSSSAARQNHHCTRDVAHGYYFDSFWPFPPFWLAMETEPGTCNKYSYQGPETCERMAHGLDFEPEWHVREVLASMLLQCSSPLDLT
ncbi:unnamed protein product [Pedinophyceae sp. YPF-701]|nr:unnamed protein product [Pedinophyceae sp. YPF-701]